MGENKKMRKLHKNGSRIPKTHCFKILTLKKVIVCNCTTKIFIGLFYTFIKCNLGKPQKKFYFKWPGH